MEEDTLSPAADLAEIPSGAVAEHGITVISYIDEDGDRAIAFATHGSPYLAETLGLMRLAEHVLFAETD